MSPVHSLVYAIRVLRRSPGFSLAALCILTLGIGANTAIFGIVDAVLLKPLPFPDSASVVTIFHVPPAQSFPGIKTFSTSPANFLDWQKRNTVFEAMSPLGRRILRLGTGGRPEPVPASVTQASFFDVLKVHPEVGRAYTAEECQPGRDDVVVLSHGFAERHFGTASNAIGRELVLNGKAKRVIGVMPARFEVKSWFPASTDAWLPLAWTAQDRAVRGNHNYLAIGRLKEGVSVAQAQAQMNLISESLAREFPEEDKGWGAVVTSLRDHLVGDVRPALLTLLGAVGFVLLIACANTANLVLARTVGRRKELAIRAAIGANAKQVVQPVLVETTLLALTGGALGLLFANSAQSLVVRALADQMPNAVDIHMNIRVLAFTLISSVLTGLAAGLIACWRLMKADLNDSLKQGLGKTDVVASGRGTRGVLVSVEVALSLMLLMGAGLMIRSLWALREVNPGFVSSKVMTMTVPIPRATNQDHRSRFYDEFLARVRSMPGVISVGAIDTLPMQDGGSQQPITIEGRPREVFALQPTVAVRDATPGYVATMHVPLLSGRDFTEDDTTGHRAVVLISKSMAVQFWPGENPIGKRFRISFTPDIVREVVGVIGDVKERGVSVLEPIATVYEPLLQDTKQNSVSLAVRSEATSSSLVPAITRILQEIDPQLPIREVQSMDQVVDNSLSQNRFSTLLFVALASLAFLLAAVGIYSVLAFIVRGRTQDISIRMALGARAVNVLLVVIVEGMKPAIAGLVLGILGSFAISGLLSRLIFGVSPTDPLTLVAVTVLLALVAILACLIPAWKASRLEPMQALRGE